MLLVILSSSMESPWIYLLRLGFENKRIKIFKRDLEVIRGLKKLMEITRFFTACLGKPTIKNKKLIGLTGLIINN